MMRDAFRTLGFMQMDRKRKAFARMLVTRATGLLVALNRRVWTPRIPTVLLRTGFRLAGRERRSARIRHQRHVAAGSFGHRRSLSTRGAASRRCAPSPPSLPSALAAQHLPHLDAV